jgi:CheY-like chemotaxis protein
MLDDLLDVSRITYGKIRLQKQSVDLVPVVRTAIVSTGALRDGLDQSLEAQFPEGEVLVEGDGVRLDQIFTNLLANAAKFTRRGGKVRVIVERERRRENLGEAVVRIRDNGVGITPAMLPRIFDLFVQVDAPSERNRTGIGLGLTLAKRLVDLHGGTIEAHSAGDALGSEFVVRLPLLEADAHASGAPAAQQEAAPARKRVLIVEDNVDSGQSLKLLLSRAGQDVRIVEDGASAVPAALDFQPHLVVLDIGLPDMDGYVVARQLRDDPRTRAAFIIAATGYGRDEDRMRSRQAGIDEHMTKPVDVDALLRRLAGMRDAA